MKALLSVARPQRILVCLCALSIALVAATTGGASGRAAAPVKLDTLQPGVLNVAIRGDLPFAALKHGKLTGIDGDIIAYLAKKLHLKIKVQVMDFAGQLAAIASGRNDVAIGSIGWKPERAHAGLFTDASYYAPAIAVERRGTSINTIAGFQGKAIGTVTGYAWVSAISAIPGTQLRTYDTADAVYADVAAGRIDIGFVDALQDIYTARVRPGLKLNTVPVKVSDAEVKAQPAYAIFGKVQLAFYLPKKEPKVTAALNLQLRKMYATGALAKILSRWGADPEVFLCPPASARARVGVDRSRGWTPPKVKGC